MFQPQLVRVQLHGNGFISAKLTSVQFNAFLIKKAKLIKRIARGIRGAKGRLGFVKAVQKLVYPIQKPVYSTQKPV